jgi:hypothetical protein
VFVWLLASNAELSIKYSTLTCSTKVIFKLGSTNDIDAMGILRLRFPAPRKTTNILNMILVECGYIVNIISCNMLPRQPWRYVNVSRSDYATHLYGMSKSLCQPSCVTAGGSVGRGPQKRTNFGLCRHVSQASPRLVDWWCRQYRLLCFRRLSSSNRQLLSARPASHGTRRDRDQYLDISTSRTRHHRCQSPIRPRSAFVRGVVGFDFGCGRRCNRVPAPTHRRGDDWSSTFWFVRPATRCRSSSLEVLLQQKATINPTFLSLSQPKDQQPSQVSTLAENACPVLAQSTARLVPASRTLSSQSFLPDVRLHSILARL